MEVLAACIGEHSRGPLPTLPAWSALGPGSFTVMPPTCQ